jgi:hypothetical protein
MGLDIAEWRPVQVVSMHLPGRFRAGVLISLPHSAVNKIQARKSQY